MSLAVSRSGVAAGETGQGRARRRIGLPFILSVATVAGAILVWALVTRLGLVSPVFLPGPDQVLVAAGDVLIDGYADSTLAQHLGASLGRVFFALVVALALAVPAGLAIGLSPVGRGVLDPVVEFLRPIPPLAYLPLIVIWLGIGEVSKMTVIALAMFPPITLSTAAGVRSTAQERIDAARALGATKLQLARFVVLPSALPSILTGLRIGLGAGWSTLVAAELVAATRGLGVMIQSAAQFLVTDVVLVGIIVIAAIAFLLELLVRLLERRFVPWRDRL